jgi:predicted dithiol-disulfide oxidoreductase (DUF899 family)
MSLPKIASRDEWMAARMELLAREKELTRQTDALNADRRRLPMVRIDEDYVFTGPDGEVGLADLFDGRRQLILQHFMFDPDWEDGCSSCSAGVDELANGLLDHLHVRDTTFAAVSRAPFEKLEDYRKRKGWEFPWYSSNGSRFNYDFHATIDESVAPLEINYRAWHGGAGRRLRVPGHDGAGPPGGVGGAEGPGRLGAGGDAGLRHIGPFNRCRSPSERP